MPLFSSSDTCRTRVSRFANSATSEDSHPGSPPALARQSFELRIRLGEGGSDRISQHIDRRIEDGHDDGDERLSRQRLPAPPLGLELDRVGLAAGAPPLVASLDRVAVTALHLEAASGGRCPRPVSGEQNRGVDDIFFFDHGWETAAEISLGSDWHESSQAEKILPVCRDACLR